MSSLKNFTRLDEAIFQKADIHENIDSVLTLMQHRFTDRITIHKAFGEIPKIGCYPAQLNQAIMNLLTNAEDAIEEKGDIWMGTWLEESVSGENAVKLSVRDNGKGIPPDVLPKIFDPFFTTKSIGSGPGLGLATSYQIIDRHNGKIEVTSEVGKGTEFVITLPVETQLIV